ncbi:MAG TPA: hypothetical protein P5228_08410 [Bacteroidales bacterium]|nr:hypothetical protein [Bacteroidales bacterium]HRZ48089.1 hypothetical protein [Bacteroidales bacterium]
MPDEKKIPELGLAEFVSTLIRETFDAIITAQEEQTEKIAQIAEIAGLPPDEVAAALLTPEDALAGLQRIFPAGEAPFSTVYENAPYRPEPNEYPPVFVTTGYIMQKADFANGKFTLTGYNSVLQKVSQMLAEEKLQLIREMMRNGLPKIQVDQGKILARVSFSVKETEGETGASPTTGTSAVTTGLPLTFLKKIDVLGGKTLKSIQLPAARMMVKQAADTGSTTSDATSVFGEVEIHFRTIT